MKFIRLLIPVCMILIIGLSACAPKEKESMAREWNWKAATIVLTPTGQAGSAGNPGNVGLPGNQGCTTGSGAKLGCVKFARTDTGTIEFALAGSPEVKICEDSGVQKVITKIEFTDRADSSDPEKGDFYATPATPLPAVVKNQAISVLDLNSGVAYSRPWTSGQTRVTLGNINGPGTPGVSGKELWWRVTITKCTDEAAVWVTDPRLVNDGMQ